MDIIYEILSKSKIFKSEVRHGQEDFPNFEKVCRPCRTSPRATIFKKFDRSLALALLK